MKKGFFYLTLLCYALALLADDNFVFEPTALDDPSMAIASLEGEPNCLVYGCVNVISGEYVDFESDLNIPGLEPLVLQRHYSSSDNRLDKPWKAWKFNHDIFMDPGDYDYNSFEKRDYCFTDSFGASLVFENVSPKGTNRYRVSESFFKRRITNHRAKYEGGRTHPKHTKFYIAERGESQKITTGEGKTYLFEPFKNNHISYIQHIKKLNGNSLKYGYGSHNRLRTVEAYNSTNEKISTLHFEFQKKHDNATLDVTADGQNASYSFAKTKYYLCYGREKWQKGQCIKNDAWLLTSASVWNKPKETYHYDIDREDLETHPRLIRKERPDGRYLNIAYYKKGRNEVWSGHEEYVEKLRKGRVMGLGAPAGRDETPILLYKFLYQLEHRKASDGTQILWGRTDVYNVYHHMTRYYSNDSQRLVKIENFKGKFEYEQIYSTENFYWGEKGTVNSCNMTAKVICQGANDPISCKNYVYDDRGNIIEESLSGNLRGVNHAPLVVNDQGITQQNGVDQLIIRHQYSKTHNLLKFENNPKADHDIYYEYVAGSDRLAARYVESNGIKQREFFQYDPSGALVCHFCDDGSEKEMTNLAGVTERQIKRYQNNQKGQPTTISEYYWDPTSSSEQLLRQTCNIYDKQGRVIKQSIYDSVGQLAYTLSWDYNQMGKLIREVNALGHAILRDYDPNGNLMREQGPGKGQCRFFRYDRMDRVTTEGQGIPYKGSLYKQYEYDLLGNKTLVTDIYGQQTAYQHDEFDRVIRIIFPTVEMANGRPIHPIQSKKYDILGNVVSVTDPQGNETIASYTLHRKPYEIIYPDGSKEHFEYSLKGHLKKAIHRDGSYTCWEYDYFSRPLKKEIYAATGELLTVETRTYNAFHLTSETDPNGLQTHYTYDYAGRLIRKEQGDHLTEYGYDTLGRQSEIKEHYGREGNAFIHTLKKYDMMNHVVEEMIQDGSGKIQSHINYVYDAAGRCEEKRVNYEFEVAVEKTSYNFMSDPIERIDALGHRTKFEYQYKSGKRNVKKTDPLGNVEITFYDANGRMDEILRKNSKDQVIKKSVFRYDPTGNRVLHREIVYENLEPSREVITRWEYDSMNRIVRLVEGEGTLEQKTTDYFYDSAGRLEAIQKNDGMKLLSSYDSLGRLSDYQSSDGTFHYHYTYDRASRPLSVENVLTGKVTKRDYDMNGRLLSEELETGLSVSYAYDRIDRPRLVSFPDKSQVRYGYQGIHLKEVARLNSDGNEVYAHHYEAYDRRGLLLTSKLPGKAGVVNTHYDDGGRIEKISSPEWQEVISKRDPKGNLITKDVVDILGRTDYEYSYDDLEQLTKEIGVINHSYNNDSLYNQVKKDATLYQLNSLNQILRNGIIEYHYDLRGNRILKKAGNESIVYTYDGLDRLVSVIIGNLKAVYDYDSFNRRLSKTFFQLEGEQWEEKKKELYLYLNNSEVGVCCEHGEIVQLRILGKGYGAEFGSAVALELENEVFVPIHDSIGHVICLLDLKGRVVETYRIGSFGEEIIYNGAEEETSRPKNPWRFCGKRMDPETGFVYFGMRYYDPETAKWISADPLGIEGGPNLYAYVLNNPWSYVDLEGLNFTSAGAQMIACYTSYITDKDYYKFEQRGKNDPLREDEVRYDGEFLDSVFNSGKSFACTVGPHGIEEGESYGISFGNGIQNSVEEAIESASYVSRLCGGRRVRLIYNPSISLETDMKRTLLCLNHGYMTKTMSNYRTEWIKSLEKVEYHIHVGHSENTTINRNTLKTLPPNLRERILLIGVCPSGYIDKKLCGKVVHLSTKRDFVDLLDYKGREMAESQGTLVNVESAEGAPWHDHSFNSPSLAPMLKFQLNRFLKQASPSNGN